MTKPRSYHITIVLTGLLLAATDYVRSQSDAYVISQQSFVRLVPLYQHWSVGDETRFSQFGVGLSVYAPLSKDLGVSLQTAHVGTQGDVTSLSGMADAKVSFNYFFERPGIVASCGISLPSGKSELTQEEFETSLLISDEVFELQIPNLGQGLTVQPGLAWARSLNDKVSVGAGVSYHYKAKYKPLADYGDYDPGDEVLLTGGVDLRIGEASSIAADVVVTMYGGDKLDGDDVFASGKKITANVQFRKYIGQHELLVSSRYRSRSANDIVIAGAFVPEEEKVAPDLFGISAVFQWQASSRLLVRFLADGRFYQQTASVLSGVNIFGAGIAPEIILSSNMKLPARARFQSGKLPGGESITGLEFGLGIAVTF